MRQVCRQRYGVGSLLWVLLVWNSSQLGLAEEGAKTHASRAVMSGPSDPRFANFDRLLNEFRETHQVPGIAVAVSYRGQVVYTRGYGYADIAGGEAVQPDSLFRIASLSKPITAVAVLQLCERGLLSLDDSVARLLDLTAVDPRWPDITLRHLLTHRGGWDRERSFDAMFQSVRFAQTCGVPAPATAAHVIQAMLAQPLDFAPGSAYAYSNFGYCLLGRVIEKVSGQSYEGYVQTNVLAPLGIRHMRIGATRPSERAPGEVHYYHPGLTASVFQADLGKPVEHPYGAWHLEAMDAHGGWLASARDVAKFAAAFDDPAHCPLLTQPSIEAMFARPTDMPTAEDSAAESPVYYSLGWQNRILDNGSVNHWHTGSLPGTASVMIRRHDGKNLIALMNTRVSPTNDNLVPALDALLHQATDTVSQWPTGKRP